MLVKGSVGDTCAPCSHVPIGEKKAKCNAPGVHAASDILNALEELRSGRSDGLLLELENVRGNMAAEDRTITCGALSIYPRSRKVTRKDMEISLTPDVRFADGRKDVRLQLVHDGSVMFFGKLGHACFMPSLAIFWKLSRSAMALARRSSRL